MKIQGRIGVPFVVALLILMSFISACERKRKSRFAQGDGEYVYTINEFTGTKYKLKTGKKLTRGVTTKADEVVVDNKTSVIRAFDAVEFSIETDFGTFDNTSMSNFQFFGATDSEYEVRGEFTEDNFVFFKVAPETRIPSDEMTYAEKIEGDLYRVPLFGLPLSKYTTERIKDDRGKSTNQIKTYVKKFLKDSTHFAVKPANPKYFATELKLDMLPAKFFDEGNEWFFEVTVVDRPLDNNEVYELGHQVTSGKAKFFKTNKTLTVVSQNIPDELKDQDPEKKTTILEIPANWMDFKLMKTGDNAYLKEEVFNDIAAGAKYWKDREYVQLQFDKIISGVVSTDSVLANTLRVKRLEVADDYFSFIVFDALSKISLHFSFAKENTINEGLNFPLEDVKKYGFFRQRRAILTDPLSSSEEASVKTTYLQRMYPKNNQITFHITENTPKDPIFIEAIEAAVVAWDGAFVEAAKGTEYEGNPIRVVLDKEKPVQNGDARYHKVSFYGYEVESGLLGYGPSVKDGRNGEVYSSTNHIYLRNYREQILRNLVKFVRYRLGVYSDLEVKGITLPNQILITAADINHDFSGVLGTPSAAGTPLSLSTDAILEETHAIAQPIDWNASIDFDKAVREGKAAVASRARKDLEVQTEYDQGYHDFQRAHRRLEEGLIDESAFGKELQASVAKTTAASCDSLAGTALSFKEIEDICMTDGNKFKDYVEELVALNQSKGLDYRLDREKEVFYDCAQKLMKPTLISTLVHEFGHNMGMTHNFAGTSDAKNFDRDATGVPTIRSTSVMDYAHYDADRGFKPGPYDIATIRYGYYRAVEVQDGKTGLSQGVVSIKTENTDITPVSERIAQKFPGAKAREFKYCYDSDIAAGEVPLETPNCRRRDQGSDPVAQARSFIDGFNSLILTSANRYDNTGIATGGGIASSAATSYFYPMKLLYDKYRYTLYEKASAIGLNDPYFDIFKARDIEQKVMGAATLKTIQSLKQEILEHSGSLAKTTDNLAVIRIEQKVQALSEIAQYKLASEFIKDFIRQLVFSDDLYCVAVTASGSAFRTAEIQPFALLRTTIYNHSGRDAARCEDSAVLDYYREIAATGALTGVTTVDQVTSVGNPTADVVYSADIQKLPIRAALRAGLSATRMEAVKMFAYRSTDTSGISLIKANSFFPSILDEEGYRSEILNSIGRRYMRGIDGSELLAAAAQKIGRPITPGIYENLVEAGSKRFFLPHFEEETEIVKNLLVAYRNGASSPLASTNEKTANIQITSSPEVSFLNFIRTAPDAAEYRYFIAGSTAYYSKGSVAREILVSLSDTFNSVTVAENMVNSTNVAGELNPSSAQQVRQRLVTFSTDFAAERASGDSTAKNVLYKVRSCVKERLVNKFSSKILGYSLESDPDFEYIQKVCRVPSLEGGDTSVAAIAKYYDEAQRLVDFLVTKDNQPLTITLVESILTQVGLPAAPDKKKTWEQIRDSSVAKPIKDVAAPNAFETALFQGIVNELITSETGEAKLLQIAKDPSTADAEIKRMNADFNLRLEAYAKYRDLFKKKVDVIQNALYLSATK